VYAVSSLIASTYLLVGHLQHAAKLTNLALCFTFMWAHLALKLIFSLGARPHDTGFDDSALAVDVVVPIYNEDPALLAAGIHSVALQTRRPRTLWLIDDGCHLEGEPHLILETFFVREAIEAAERAGVRVECRRQENHGKRHAQSVAFSASDADVFVTVDSDTVLHAEAIAKLLTPFGDARVMSVGGAACGQNYRRSLFTRVVEIGFVMSFIQGRMAEGFFGSVRVNCGILAAYRGDVVRDNLSRFLGQRFLGRAVRAGDDRMLTLFAKERGRAEFQPEAVAYSALPVNLHHLVRQRLRWCRSFCWGTLWLLRRPLTSADFWFTFTQVLAMVMYGITSVVSVSGALTGAISPALLLSTVQTATAVGLISHFRYVLLARPGEPLTQRLLTWALSPLTSVLSWSVLMPLYFVAVATPRPRHGWGTRRTVEVRLQPQTV
jgi:cellulose synthase/poly-beta-1,6-N-acetylglucosamine synthase-like glycosyltransferase